MLEIRKRAEMFGSIELLHYVFPALRSAATFNGNEIFETKFIIFDPTRPIGSWRRAWRNLTKEAGLAGLRFHDLRHHAITELAEAGVPEQTIMAIAGHVSRRMLNRYSHVRLEAKRTALEALSPRGPVVTINAAANSSEGYGTKRGTNSDAIPVYSDLTTAPIDKAEIGACGFEPQTPTVSR